MTAATDFRPLAGPYTSAQSWMLDRVVRDLKAGGIAHKIIKLDDGQLEIWRTTYGWLEVAAEEVAP